MRHFTLQSNAPSKVKDGFSITSVGFKFLGKLSRTLPEGLKRQKRCGYVGSRDIQPDLMILKMAVPFTNLYSKAYIYFKK